MHVSRYSHIQGFCALGGKVVPARKRRHCCSCAVGLSSSVSE